VESFDDGLVSPPGAPGWPELVPEVLVPGVLVPGVEVAARGSGCWSGRPDGV